MTIPFYGILRQHTNLKDELLDATDKVLRQSCMIGGPLSASFKEWLCQKTRYNHVILTHSGTQALEILAKAYKEFGHSTITIPDLTYRATLNALKSAGLTVSISDVGEHGVMVPNENNGFTCFVGYAGASPTYSSYSPSLIDGAQHWLAPQQLRATYGMAISFDPTKNLANLGNGGAILTNHQSIATYCQLMTTNATTDYGIFGTNSRMSELDCAHLLVKTNYIDGWQARRKDIRNYYLSQFSNLPIKCLSSGFQSHADQKFVIWYSDRGLLNAHLQNRGIETKIHYEYTLSELVEETEVQNKQNMLSTSTMLCHGVLSLPIYPELTDAEVEHIAESVKVFFADTK